MPKRNELVVPQVGEPKMFELGYWPDKGYVLNGNVLDAPKWLIDMHCNPAVVVADPPYGNILDEPWDKQTEEQLLQEWIVLFKNLERFGAPIYWWGGIGKPGYRPFLMFILQVESETSWRMRDLITWKKVRAYGKSSTRPRANTSGVETYGLRQSF
jgi:hypothetical protein